MKDVKMHAAYWVPYWYTSEGTPSKDTPDMWLKSILLLLKVDLFLDIIKCYRDRFNEVFQFAQILIFLVDLKLIFCQKNFVNKISK